MECTVEFSGANIRFNFVQNKFKQKSLIAALLQFSKLDLATLALLIEVPEKILIKVFQGNTFLKEEAAVLLGQIFLIAFSD